MENPKTMQIEKAKPKIKRVVRSRIPEEILKDKLLNEAIKVLPSNYNFEIHKSIWRIREMKKTLEKNELTVCLQFPEGLMLYACIIADIIRNFTGSEIIINGDVTYGACCIDDLTAQALGADFVVHYAHSCLVPIGDMVLKALYVFVDILIDLDHFLDTIRLNFEEGNRTFYLLSTIQFNSSVFSIRDKLNEEGYRVIVPQERPRCAGETLGCTSPKLDLSESDTVVYLCDGRFHMEGVMIANPKHNFFQYSPYEKNFTIEKYDYPKMIANRKSELARCNLDGSTVGVILGVLGRQGSTHILDRLVKEIEQRNCDYVTILLSEVFPDQLALFQDKIDFFVQIACPRLSIDWGMNFKKPLLSTYEFYTLLGKVEFKDEDYPMDFYSDKGGEWTNYYHRKRDKKSRIKIKRKKRDKPKIKIEFENEAN